jgi:hypothetical protein
MAWRGMACRGSVAGEGVAFLLSISSISLFGLLLSDYLLISSYLWMIYPQVQNFPLLPAFTVDYSVDDTTAILPQCRPALFTWT